MKFRAPAGDKKRGERKEQSQGRRGSREGRTTTLFSQIFARVCSRSLPPSLIISQEAQVKNVTRSRRPTVVFMKKKTPLLIFNFLMDSPKGIIMRLGMEQNRT